MVLVSVRDIGLYRYVINASGYKHILALLLIKTGLKLVAEDRIASQGTTEHRHRMGSTRRRLCARLPYEPNSASRGNKQAIGASPAMSRNGVRRLRVQTDQGNGIINIAGRETWAISIRRACQLPSVDVFCGDPCANGLYARRIGDLKQFPPILLLISHRIHCSGNIRRRQLAQMIG